MQLGIEVRAGKDSEDMRNICINYSKLYVLSYAITLELTNASK